MSGAISVLRGMTTYSRIQSTVLKPIISQPRNTRPHPNHISTSSPRKNYVNGQTDPRAAAVVLLQYIANYVLF